MKLWQYCAIMQQVTMGNAFLAPNPLLQVAFAVLSVGLFLGLIFNMWRDE